LVQVTCTREATALCGSADIAKDVEATPIASNSVRNVNAFTMVTMHLVLPRRASDLAAAHEFQDVRSWRFVAEKSISFCSLSRLREVPERTRVQRYADFLTRVCGATSPASRRGEGLVHRSLPRRKGGRAGTNVIE
jgi:hypothetical protein